MGGAGSFVYLTSVRVSPRFQTPAREQVRRAPQSCMTFDPCLSSHTQARPQLRNKGDMGKPGSLVISDLLNEVPSSIPDPRLSTEGPGSRSIPDP